MRVAWTPASTQPLWMPSSQRHNAPWTSTSCQSFFVPVAPAFEHIANVQVQEYAICSVSSLIQPEVAFVATVAEMDSDSESQSDNLNEDFQPW
jgi:hypothetical protein